LIPPNQLCYYEADQDDPWTYAWATFSWAKMEEYFEQTESFQYSPIFNFEHDYFLKDLLLEMLDSDEPDKKEEIRLQGLAYVMISDLLDNLTKQLQSRYGRERNSSKICVQKAIYIIEANYSSSLSVSQISSAIGITRGYLCDLFKRTLQMSPQEYIIRFRMKKACKLLNDCTLSIGDVSRSVGYNDQFTFSLAFKRIYGMSPQSYRNSLNNKKI
jgi:AraC family transcriptional regulator of arabinose operon